MMQMWQGLVVLLGSVAKRLIGSGFGGKVSRSAYVSGFEMRRWATPILRPMEKRAAPILMHELSWDARSGERFSRFNRRECLSRSEGLVRESL